jgi:ferredoxin
MIRRRTRAALDALKRRVSEPGSPEHDGAVVVLGEGRTTATIEEASEEASGSRFAAIARLAAEGGLGEAHHADDRSTNVAAYAARARAKGLEVELAGEGLNRREDGAVFWGPVDNPSSRAKATDQVLTIDQWECITCGTCEENTTLVFEVPSGEKAEVLAQNGPMDLIQDAIEACPVTCIHWLSEADIEEHHSHGGFESA